MSKWKFTLPNSKELRYAIGIEDCDAIYRQIIEAWKWLASTRDDDYTIDSYLDDVEFDLECQAFDEESVDSHLSNLYDYCDENGVWIEI